MWRRIGLIVWPMPVAYKILKLFVVFINTKNNLDIISNITNSMIKYVFKLLDRVLRRFKQFFRVNQNSNYIAM